VLRSLVLQPEDKSLFAVQSMAFAGGMVVFSRVCWLSWLLQRLTFVLCGGMWTGYVFAAVSQPTAHRTRENRFGREGRTSKQDSFRTYVHESGDLRAARA
jgi:hypothetical protein